MQWIKTFSYKRNFKLFTVGTGTQKGRLKEVILKNTKRWDPRSQAKRNNKGDDCTRNTDCISPREFSE